MSNKFVGDFTKVDSGTQAWTVFSFLGSDSWRVTGGTGRSLQFCNSQANIADCEIIGKIATSVVASNLPVGLILRYTDVDNYYFAIFQFNDVHIFKCVAGVFTLLGSESFSRSTNTYYWLRFRCLSDGLAADVSLNGVDYTPRVFVNDSALATGKGGFYTFLGASPLIAYFDDIEFNQHNPTP